jgi:methyl-accepting chemotaxis protein
MAKIFRNVTVRAMLGGLVGIMGLVLGLMCTNYLVAAWRHYDAGARVAELSVANKAIFEVMQTFRFERGDTASGLATVGDPIPELQQRIAKTRAAVDQQMALALPVIDRAQVADLPAIRDKLKADYAILKDLRPRADAALRQPAAARDKDIVEGFGPKASPFLEDLERTATVLEAGMRQFDPSIGELALMRSAAWEARSALGNKIVIVLGALAKRQPLSLAQQAAIEAANGRAGAFWQLVRENANRTGAPADLRDAYDKAQSGYFGHASAKKLDGIIRSLSAGEVPDVTAAALGGRSSDRSRCPVRWLALPPI